MQLSKQQIGFARLKVNRSSGLHAKKPNVIAILRTKSLRKLPTDSLSIEMRSVMQFLSLYATKITVIRRLAVSTNLKVKLIFKINFNLTILHLR